VAASITVSILFEPSAAVDARGEVKQLGQVNSF